MARPHIEFIQSQVLPWRSRLLVDGAPPVDVRVLSEDNETGAASLLVRYPAGFDAPACALSVDEEFLVLEGELTFGDHHHRQFGYGHFPAGYDPGARVSATGAVVLTFFSGRVAPASSAIAFDPRRLVEAVNGLHIEYTGNFHPEFPPGAGRKRLFTDPQSGDETWLLGTLPLRWAERSEVHPTVEEMYLLSGEVHGDRGIMRPGAYFWRPPQIPHGPFGTLTGNFYFFRTKGGGLSTSYVEPRRPHRWWPENDLALPDDLAALMNKPTSSPTCW
jgi:hypothetical protein